MPPKKTRTPTPTKKRKKAAVEINMATDENEPEFECPETEEQLLKLEIPPRVEQGSQLSNSEERLTISHIEVENFKSYFGKQIIGPFHKNFTSIIGANGSGKSNVIDALLFVFGYKAAKIRCKKVSVLIHSSAGRENLRSCTVAIHFQKIVYPKSKDGEFNRDELNIVEGSQFTVSRTAFRDNSSRYQINGRVALFKDVASLLRKNGIDLIHNRFLILQGEVEQISLMKPKAKAENEEGMLEYLEDIIGSNRLKPYIMKFQEWLDKIDEERVNQLQRLTFAERQKIEMEEPISKVLSKMKLQNAIATVKNKIFSIKGIKRKEKVEGCKNEQERVSEEIRNFEHELKTIEEESRKFAEQQKRIQKELEKCQELLQETKKQFEDQKQSKSKLKNDQKRTELRQEQLSNKIEVEKYKFEQLQAAPENSQKIIDESKIELKNAEIEFEESAATVQEKLKEVEQKTEALQKTKNELTKKLDELTNQENEINSHLVLAQAKLSNLRREEDLQRDKYANLKNRKSELEEKLAKKEREHTSAVNCLPKMQDSLKGQEEKLKSLRSKENELNSLVKTLCTQHNEERKSLETFKSSNRLLNCLMKEKTDGRIPGIYGRLGDLGGIDSRYDVAISTTCAALDNIVVDNVDTAQKCIEFLKQEKLGTQSFIALDKQQHFWPKIKNCPRTPFINSSSVPRLFDLIKVKDEQVRPAFYFALRDTLIASDMRDATSIAFNGGQRWRVVTLNGELVETSGAMTGGGSKQIRGKIGRSALVDTNARVQDMTYADGLANLEQRIQNAKSELRDVQQEINIVNVEHQRSISEVQRLKQTVKDSEFDLENFKEQIRNLSDQIQTQEGNVKAAIPDEKEVKNLESEVKKWTHESAESAKTTEPLRMRIVTISSQINDINDEIVGKFLKKRDEAQRNKSDLEKVINKEKAAIARNKHEISKVNQRIIDLTNDLNEAKGQFSFLGAQLEELEQKIEELESEVITKQEKVREAETALSKEFESNKSKNSDICELNKKINDLKREKGQWHAKLSEARAKLNANNDEISKLQLYRMKEFRDIINSGNEPSFIIDNDEEDEPENDNLNISPRKSQRSSQILMKPDDLDEFLDTSDQDSGTENDTRNGNDENEDARDTHDYRNYFCKPRVYKDEEILQFDKEKLQEQLASLESTITDGVNMALLEEYRNRISKFKSEVERLESINNRLELHRKQLEKFKKQRLHEFMEGFRQIAESVKEIYQMVTLQGDACLELVDSLDPFSEGISFSVRPPKKSWKQIGNLSGGEKTLASLSFVFGLHTYRPSPFYVMDEIDAALDFRNVSIISIYILERTLNTQFIIVSLRNQMFERANRLVGIYKIDDCTCNVVIDPNAISEQYKQDRKVVRRFFQTECVVSDDEDLRSP